MNFLLGKGRILKKGNDITILGVSFTVEESLKAAELLNEVGVNAEVIDPISLSPIDYDLIRNSVNKTKKLLVVDNAWTKFGFASEVITDVSLNVKHCISERLGFAETPCPTTPSLEKYFYPSPQLIAKKANLLCNGDDTWEPPSIILKEISSFKGPF